MKKLKLSPIEAELYLKRVTNQLKIKLARALAQTLREGREFAVQMSSGDVSEAELRRMGHPYAKRHYRNGKWGARRTNAPAVPFGDPAVINAQTADEGFREHWKTEGPNYAPGGGGGLMGRIYNDSDHAGFLESGTRFMIRRPIEEAVESVAKPLLKEKVVLAIVDAVERP